MEKIRFHLFGHLEVSGAPGALLAPLRPRAQRFLVYLFLHRHRARSRQEIAFTLFPDLTEANALASLRRALNDLRAALASLYAFEWILAEGGGLRWNTNAPYTLDVQEFEQLLQTETPSSLYNAIQMYRGDLVRNLDDEWLLGERERLRQLQSSALEKLVTHHRALGEFSIALELARRWLTHDPFAEAAHREVIALHYEMGDRAAALAHYERARAQWRDELGVEPMNETRALIAAITQGASLPALDAPASKAKPPPQKPREVLGRRAELERLLELWERAQQGQGSVVLISGEAGIGKSYLAQAFAERVQQRGALVLAGYCYGLEQALPYQPILEMLRAAAHLLRRAELHSVHRAALARVAPDVLGALGSPSEPDILPGELRAQLFEALTASFVALARSQPLVLIVEDAHWAAESTLDWLAYLAPHLRERRLLVLITHRAGESAMAHALANLEQRLRRASEVAVFTLPPLSREANRALVVQLSRLPETEVAGLADRLYDQAAGNPFFVQELARGMIEAGQIQVQEGQWRGALVQDPTHARLALPNSLRATINARVENLTERARTFLRGAAVAGRAFDHSIVQRASNWEDELALAALEELLARNFVRQGEDTASPFHFAHHLVQDALYAELTIPRRAYLHRRLAEAIQELRPNDFEALAHHWLQAGDSINAVNALHQQATRANNVYAYGDALRALEQASSIVVRLRQSPNTDPKLIAQEIQILLDRAALMDAVGRPLAEYERVVQAAGARLEQFPNEPLQIQYLVRHAELLSMQAQYERAARVALQAHEASHALGDLRGAAHAMYLAGVNKSTLSQNHQARRYFENALDLYGQASKALQGAPLPNALGWLSIATGESLCLSGLGIVGTNLGQVHYALTHLSRALELSERRGDKPGMARACYISAIGWSYFYHAERIEFFAQRALNLYEEMGLALTAYRPRLLLGSVRHLRGQDDAATELYAQCFAEAQAKHDSRLEGWAAQYLGRMALTRGALPQAEHFLQHAYQLRHENGELSNEISDLHWLGRLHLAQGDAPAALASSQQALQQFEMLSSDFYVWEIADVFFGHAQTLLANGDAAGAARYVQHAYDELMRFAQQIEEPSARESFFAYALNAHIVEAWRARQT